VSSSAENVPIDDQISLEVGRRVRRSTTGARNSRPSGSEFDALQSAILFRKSRPEFPVCLTGIPPTRGPREDFDQREIGLAGVTIAIHSHKHHREETTMVMRETGADWLASMMRAERRPDERVAPESAWLLDGAPDAEMIEALERWAAKDPPAGEDLSSAPCAPLPSTARR